MNTPAPSTTPSRPLRVLFLSITSLLGGAERSLLDILDTFPENMVAPHVVLFDEGPLAEELRARNIPVEVFDQGALRAFSRAGGGGWGARLRGLWSFLCLGRRLARHARQHNIDLIHSNSWKTHYLSLFCRILTRIPIVWHIRDIVRDSREGNLFRRLARWCPRQVIANSEATRNSLCAPTDALAGHITVIPNAVHLEAYQNGNRTAMRQTWGCADTTYTILHVGMLCPLKGQHFMLEVADLLRTRIPEHKLVFVGAEAYDTADPELQGYRQRLDEEIARRGLATHVHFAGALEHMADAYAAADVVVSSSQIPESFGRSIVEAMAADTPVVAFDEGGPATIITDNQTGRLVPPRDANAMATALAALHVTPAQRAEWTKSAAKLVDERYNRARLGADCLEIYHTILYT